MTPHREFVRDGEITGQDSLSLGVSFRPQSPSGQRPCVDPRGESDYHKPG